MQRLLPPVQSLSEDQNSAGSQLPKSICKLPIRVVGHSMRPGNQDRPDPLGDGPSATVPCRRPFQSRRLGRPDKAKVSSRLRVPTLLVVFPERVDQNVQHTVGVPTTWQSTRPNRIVRIIHADCGPRLNAPCHRLVRRVYHVRVDHQQVQLNADIWRLAVPFP